MDAGLKGPLAGLGCSRLVEQVLLQGWGLTGTIGGSVAAMMVTMLGFLADRRVASFRFFVVRAEPMSRGGWK